MFRINLQKMSISFFKIFFFSTVLHFHFQCAYLRRNNTEHIRVWHQSSITKTNLYIANGVKIHLNSYFSPHNEVKFLKTIETHILQKKFFSNLLTCFRNQIVVYYQTVGHLIITNFINNLQICEMIP